MKRMQHPEHGYHDAQTVKEADEMRKSGWVDYVAPAEDKTDDKAEKAGKG